MGAGIDYFGDPFKSFENRVQVGHFSSVLNAMRIGMTDHVVFCASVKVRRDGSFGGIKAGDGHVPSGSTLAEVDACG